MGNFISNIVNYFISKPWLFFVLFLGILSLLINGLFLLNINEDLYSIFPKSEEYKKFNAIIQENAINKQIIFSIDAIDDPEKLEEQLEKLNTDLAIKFKKSIVDITIYRNVNEKSLINFLQKTSVLNLNDQDYIEIERKLNKDSIEFILNNVSKKLAGGNGFFLKSFFALDPLGLTFKQLENVKPEQGKQSYIVKDGLIYTKDEKRILFFGSIAGDSKDIKWLNELNNDLKGFKKTINKKEKLNFDYFGTFQIAVENANQVKADTYLTSFLSIGLILLLLVIYYRSILAPLYFVFPALFGVLSGMGMVGYIEPNISAISLATSSVLIGIVLDYTFHFFTHYKHTGDLLLTIKEISSPMIVGSFTTVAALAALLFAESVILQNFGLIALFTLVGSVIFTLLFQPILFTVLKLKIPTSALKSNDKKLPKLFLRLGFLLVGIITCMSFLTGLTISFDADINNLSFHSDELKKKEDFFTGINPGEEKKFYIISSQASLEKGKESNYQVYDSIVRNRRNFEISEIISTAPYLPPKSEITSHYRKWLSFWENKQEFVKEQITETSLPLNLSKKAFNPFYNWIQKDTFDVSQGKELVDEIGLSKFSYYKNGKHTFITSIVLDRDKLQECKTMLKTIPNVYILDISEMTELMLNSVQKDFNFLLVFSALLVFVTLLLIYGRIELALFAFLPLVLGWIWILGITNFFEIKFNFVNIVITTFIFGLGDDFSIFTTDGLIQQYRTGNTSYKSYRSAIVLSGLTTIFGTGVLLFADHPAIHSIALISVVGISTILLITLFLQPYIFNFFVFNRLKKKLNPATFLTLIFSIILFSYFFIGSILLSLFLIFILFPFPLKKVKKRAFLNFLISKLTKSIIYFGFHIKKRIFIDKVDLYKPKIIVANHSSFLDILLVLMINPKTVIMVKSWVYNSPVFGIFIRYAGFPYAKEGTSMNLIEIQKRIEEGYSIVIFPEGTRSINGEMNRFHKGAFYLAQELKLDIQPLLLIGVSEVNPKNDILINRGHIIIKALDAIPFSEKANYNETTKRVKKLMNEGMIHWHKELAGIDFWEQKVIKNYLLKGPILEWYVRIKWKLEKKNFAYYDTLIDDRKIIYDFGCGYGYLSYYLHYRDKTRQITGVDYDKDKIDVADNCVKLSEQITFVCNDLRTQLIEKCDVVFLNDVLHYLAFSDQQKLLNDIEDKLNNNGLIFIRDGLKNDQKSHKMTKITEILSTNVFGFNKSENPLEFISEIQINEFAKSKNMSVEFIKHSNTTSNVLIILRKREFNETRETI